MEFDGFPGEDFHSISHFAMAMERRGRPAVPSQMRSSEKGMADAPKNFADLLGQAARRWGDMPRDIQEALFETAMKGHDAIRCFGRAASEIGTKPADRHCSVTTGETHEKERKNVDRSVC
jgi:hypothetical protein